MSPGDHEVDTGVPALQPAPRRIDPVFEAIAEHPSVAIAFLSAALIVARTLSVSRFQVDVAVAIVQGNGVAGLAVGTALAMAPYYAPGLALAMQMTARDLADTGRSPTGMVILTLVLWIFAILTAPLLLVAVLGIGAVGMELATGAARRRRTAPPVADTVASSRLVIALFAFFMGTFLTFTSSTWLPLERIELAGGEERIGYVLDQAGDWTRILGEDDRQIEFLKSGSIETRVQCVPQMFRVATLWEFLGSAQPPEFCTPSPFEDLPDGHPWKPATPLPAPTDTPSG